MKQTFGPDHEYINLSTVSDLIISTPQIGCTVKIDHVEEDAKDPYALCAVVNCSSKNEGVTQIVQYLMKKCEKNTIVCARLEKLFKKSVGGIGLLFTERLLNMPPQIFPNMLRITLQEIDSAAQKDSLYKFDYFLLISKVYNEVESLLDEDGTEKEIQQPKKKTKMVSVDLIHKLNSFLYFQPEDEVFEKHAEAVVDFKFSKPNQEADSKRTFQDYGIDASRRLLLVPSSKMQQCLTEITELLK